MKSEKTEELAASISMFINWFSANESVLKKALIASEQIDTSKIVDQLDQLILSFGKFSWHAETKNEIDFHFTISPNSDRELLALSQQIIQEIPPLNNWTFHPSKQANGDLSISIYDHEMDIHYVDASSWIILIEGKGDNKSELIIYADNMSELDEETQIDAADAIITNILGEKLKIELLYGIELRNQLSEEEKSMAIPLKNMKYSLLS